MEGFEIFFNFIIVDILGFGDIRGIVYDKVIIEQICRFFNVKGLVGIDYVDVICFIVQVGNLRFILMQQYVFDRILVMFGKDIKKNILVFFMFVDG